MTQRPNDPTTRRRGEGSLEGGENLARGADREVETVEIAAVPGDEGVGADPEGGSGLDGILEISKAEDQGLLEIGIAKGDDIDDPKEIRDRAGGDPAVFLPLDEVVNRRRCVSCHVAFRMPLFDRGKESRGVIEPWLARQHDVEHDMDVEEQFQAPYFLAR